ncbi:MAG: conjugal transfer protein TraX [Oscillospiraceae bacterium]|nr:conjugal transfer protein TraX [Oscillospiraceae bacterium]
MTLTEKRGFSSFALRMLALVFMLLDHAWFALAKPAMPWMTCAGRLAMPLFAFLIAEGCVHTSNFKKYALRLLVFGVISEIPFNLLTMSNFLNPTHQNVMFTLFLGLVSLRVLLWAKQERTLGAFAAAIALFAAAFLAADVLYLDYGGMGVTMVVLFGLSRQLPYKLLWQTVGLVLISAMIPGRSIMIGSVVFPIQYFSVLSMLFISLYNGKKGAASKLLQYGAYWFYPVHLGALAVLRYLT